MSALEASIFSAERLSSLARAAASTSCHGKTFCGPGQVERMVRRFSARLRNGTFLDLRHYRHFRPTKRAYQCAVQETNPIEN
jgi:hypothetical protein